MLEAYQLCLSFTAADLVTNESEVHLLHRLVPFMSVERIREALAAPSVDAKQWKLHPSSYLAVLASLSTLVGRNYAGEYRTMALQVARAVIRLDDEVDAEESADLARFDAMVRGRRTLRRRMCR